MVEVEPHEGLDEGALAVRLLADHQDSGAGQVDVTVLGKCVQLAERVEQLLPTPVSDVRIHAAVTAATMGEQLVGGRGGTEGFSSHIVTVRVHTPGAAVVLVTLRRAARIGLESVSGAR